MRKFTILEEVFIDWYFNSDSDQEQEALALDLGRSIIQQMLDGGKVEVTPQDFLDACNHEIIPCRLLEEFSDDNENELGEEFSDGDYEVTF
jgi:hypothetical protein